MGPIPGKCLCAYKGNRVQEQRKHHAQGLAGPAGPIRNRENENTDSFAKKGGFCILP